MDRNHSDASRSRRGEEAVARRLGDALGKLERPAPPSAGDCPDPEQIAAYRQRMLAGEEVAQCESHFAVCARCREVLSLVAATDDVPLVARAAVARAQPAEPARPRFSQWRWSRSYWLVPALAATGALALFLIVRAPWRSSERASSSLTAEAPAPEQLQAPPPAPASAPPPDQRSGSSALSPNDAARNPAGAAANAPAAPLEAENFARAARSEAPAAATNSGAAKSQVPPAPPPEPATRSADTLAAQSATPPPLTAGAESAANAAPDSAENATGGAVQAERMPAPAPSAAASASQPAPARLSGTFSALARNPFPVSLKSPSSAIAWRAGIGGLIQRSSDGGRTWQSQSSPLADDWLGGSAVSDTVCWLAGRNGAIARTVDGRRWEQIPGPPMAADSSGKQPDWVTVMAIDAQTAVIGSAIQIRYITRDAGNTWQQLP